MSYIPIARVLTPIVDSAGDPYSGAVLKAYAAGTSTNISMATDYTGLTTFTSVALDSNGYPSVNSSIVIPHVNVDYKLSLYPDQTAADANSGAIWTIDDLPVGVSFNSIANYDKAEIFFIENDVGADSTTFDVDANIAAAWESVGPTGSGATNIWTALDSVPSGAKYVELKIRNRCDDSTGAAITQVVYLRKTGSATSIGFQTQTSTVDVTATGATATSQLDVGTYKVPIDTSGRFDVYFVSSGTTRNVALWLVGFGV